MRNISTGAEKVIDGPERVKRREKEREKERERERKRERKTITVPIKYSKEPTVWQSPQIFQN